MGVSLNTVHEGCNTEGDLRMSDDNGKNDDNTEDPIEDFRKGMINILSGVDKTIAGFWDTYRGLHPLWQIVVSVFIAIPIEWAFSESSEWFRSIFLRNL